MKNRYIYGKINSKKKKRRQRKYKIDFYLIIRYKNKTWKIIKDQGKLTSIKNG